MACLAIACMLAFAHSPYHVHHTQSFQVALKQLIPDNEVALFGGALKFRAKVRGRAVN